MSGLGSVVWIRSETDFPDVENTEAYMTLTAQTADRTLEFIASGDEVEVHGNHPLAARALHGCVFKGSFFVEDTLRRRVAIT